MAHIRLPAVVVADGVELTGWGGQPGVEGVLHPSAGLPIPRSGQAGSSEGQHPVPHTQLRGNRAAVGRAAVERPQLTVAEAQGGIHGEQGRESEGRVADAVIGAGHGEGPGHPLAVEDLRLSVIHRTLRGVMEVVAVGLLAELLVVHGVEDELVPEEVHAP